MTQIVDLDRYFARIGYAGSRAPTLAVLRELHALHPLAIPFENLDPLRGRRVSLELGAIQAKLVEGRRGGYCYEQNRLFAHVLMQLGFAVTPMVARVLWGRPADFIPPPTHMMLRVDVDGGAWIADVGFSAVTPTAPLALEPGLEQSTPLETFRLARTRPDALDLQVRSREAWATAYRFVPQRVEWVDYEVFNWYSSSAPESRFTQQLVVSRVLPAGRLALFNTRLTERDAQGVGVAEREIADAGELAACLGGRFGIALEGIDVAAVFARAASAGQIPPR